MKLGRNKSVNYGFTVALHGRDVIACCQFVMVMLLCLTISVWRPTVVASEVGVDGSIAGSRFGAWGQLARVKQLARDTTSSFFAGQDSSSGRSVWLLQIHHMDTKPDIIIEAPCLMHDSPGPQQYTGTCVSILDMPAGTTSFEMRTCVFRHNMSTRPNDIAKAPRFSSDWCYVRGKHLAHVCVVGKKGQGGGASFS
jgi:hypothetical protein